MKTTSKILLLAIAVAASATLWASSKPDGLEKVAESLGFIHKAVEGKALLNYNLFGGILGALIIFAIFSASILFLRLYQRVQLKK